MQIRLIGLPAEVAAAVTVLREGEDLAVVAVSQPYACRGDARQVRVYVTALTRTDLPTTGDTR